MDEDNAEIRKAAALTCCKLFMRDPVCYQASNHSLEVVGDVINKLLSIGIADPGTFQILSFLYVLLLIPSKTQASVN